MRWLWSALFVVSVLGLAVAPGWLRHEPPYDDEVVLISPHWEGIKAEFGRAFQAHYAGRFKRTVRVTWLDIGGTGEISKYITERSKQARERHETGIGADVFFGGGMDILPSFAAAGVFQPTPLPDELAAQLPSSLNGQVLRDPKNLFFACCLSSFGFVFNSEVLARAKLPEPKSWDDLGSPEFAGWISCGDPTQAGSLHQAFEIVLQSEGWERGCVTLARLLSNTRAFNEGGPSVPRDVSLGQAAAGPCIDFYATAPIRRQGATQLKLVVPSGAAIVTPDSIAVLAGAPHPVAAREFVLFTLSEAGQRLWYQPRGTPGGPRDYDLERLPVMPAIYDSGAPTNTVLNPYKNPATFQFDSGKSGARWTLLNNLMRAIWIDAHDDLVAARARLIASGTDAEKVAEFCRPPVTEAELLALARKKPAAGELNQMRNAWTAWARERYARP